MDVVLVAVPLLMLGAIIAWMMWVSRAVPADEADGIPVAALPQTAAPSVDPTPEPTRSVNAEPRPGVDPAWLARTSAATGIAERPLLGYAAAALRLKADDPGCGITWVTIAAVGFVESADGRHDGARIRDDGELVGAILGPVLDGHGYDAVRDTDQGALDGNTTWDRAVGPMQFLPSIWRHYGADDSGDGVADPNQIDDAALGAGRLLCAAGGDLRTLSGWRAAVSAYNPADTYVDTVLERARYYATVTR